MQAPLTVDAMMPISITLPIHQWQAVITGLGEARFKDVAMLINAIGDQMQQQAQQQAQQMAAPQDAPGMGNLSPGRPNGLDHTPQGGTQ